MKSSFVFLFVLLTLQYHVEGGLVRDFFGKVHDTVQVVGTDIRKVWSPGMNNSTDANPAQSTTASVPVVTAQSQPEVTPEGTNNHEAPQVPENQEPVQVTESTSTTIATGALNTTLEATTTGPTSTTTEGKDGRENFKGGCSTGYFRTPDGRCEASF